MNEGKGRSSADRTTERDVLRITGLALRRVAPIRLAEALQELRNRGMNVAYENQIVIAPDDRVLLVFADRAFGTDSQRRETNAILAELLDNDDPNPIGHRTEGAHGRYAVVDFLRI